MVMMTAAMMMVMTIVTSIERFSNDCRKNQYQSNHSDQSQQEQTAQYTNQNSYQLPVTCSIRGKYHAYKLRLALVFLLIG